METRELAEALFNKKNAAKQEKVLDFFFADNCFWTADSPSALGASVRAHGDVRSHISKLPIGDGCQRKDATVTEYKTFVIEMDPDTAPELGTLQQSVDFVQANLEALPDSIKKLVSMAVFSGNKSIHFWITCEECLGAYAWKQLGARIAAVVSVGAKVGKVDKQVLCVPSQPVRCPGALRDRKTLQTILYFNPVRASQRTLSDALNREEKKHGLTPTKTPSVKVDRDAGADVVRALESCGAKVAQYLPNGVTFYRPGKRSQNRISAIYHLDTQLFHCFSDKWEGVQANKTYTKRKLLALLSGRKERPAAKVNFNDEDVSVEEGVGACMELRQGLLRSFVAKASPLMFVEVQAPSVATGSWTPFSVLDSSGDVTTFVCKQTASFSAYEVASVILTHCKAEGLEAQITDELDLTNQQSVVLGDESDEALKDFLYAQHGCSEQLQYMKDNLFFATHAAHHISARTRYVDVDNCHALYLAFFKALGEDSGNEFERVFSSDFENLVLSKNNGWLHVDEKAGHAIPLKPDWIARTLVNSKTGISRAAAECIEVGGQVSTTGQYVTPWEGLETGRFSFYEGEAHVFQPTIEFEKVQQTVEMESELRRAEAVLVEEFGNIDLGVIRALVIGGLVAQSGASTIPFALITGSSQSGKTVHSKLAGCILGGWRLNTKKAGDKEYTEILRQPLTSETPIVILDEGLSGTSGGETGSRREDKKLVDFIKSNASEQDLRNLYSEARSFRLKSLVCITGIDSQGLERDSQVNRRVVKIEMASRKLNIDEKPIQGARGVLGAAARINDVLQQDGSGFWGVSADPKLRDAAIALCKGLWARHVRRGETGNNSIITSMRAELHYQQTVEPAASGLEELGDQDTDDDQEEPGGASAYVRTVLAASLLGTMDSWEKSFKAFERDPLQGDRFRTEFLEAYGVFAGAHAMNELTRQSTCENFKNVMKSNLGFIGEGVEDIWFPTIRSVRARDNTVTIRFGAHEGRGGNHRAGPKTFTERCLTGLVTPLLRERKLSAGCVRSMANRFEELGRKGQSLAEELRALAFSTDC